MTFKVTLDDKEIEFTPKELFAFLLEKAKERVDSEESLQDINSYIDSIFSLLPKDFSLKNSNLQIYKLYFLAGFYFSSFVSKNQTQITKNVKV